MFAIVSILPRIARWDSLWLGNRGWVHLFGAYLEHLRSAPGRAPTWLRSKSRPGGGGARPFGGVKVTFGII